MSTFPYLTKLGIWPPPNPLFQFQDVDILRADLTDEAYADWFLEGKMKRGMVNPVHFLNDLVLFRVALDWPRGSKGWALDADDISNAHFSLRD